jgi:hypothetical protein
LIPLEIGVRRLRQEAGVHLLRLAPTKTNRAWATWMLALIPLAIVPPLLALLLIRKPSEMGVAESDRIWVATFAVVNLLLSFLFWRWLATSVFEIGPALWLHFDELGRRVVPAVRPTPI